MYIARNVQALRSAQVAWDNAMPDESESWVESTEGANWLSDCAEQLRSGHDVKIGGKVVVSAKDFILEYSQTAAELYGADDEFAMEWALAKGQPFTEKRYPAKALEVAERMLLEHAEAAEQEALKEVF